MAETIAVAQVHGYTAEIHRLMAQSQTKLRGAVRVKSGLVGKSYNFERLGPSDLVPITVRHSATPILNPVHSRRRVTPNDRGGAILLDRQDTWRILIEPGNDYARNHADSGNRFIDDMIIAAATGNSVAVDEADATSNVTLASWDGGSHVVASGALGMTFDKVNQTARLLNEDEVPAEDRFFIVSPQAIEDLLAEAEFTNSQYAGDLRAVKWGTIPAGAVVMGFQWIMSNRLAIDGSLDRTCIAFQRRAIGLGVWADLQVEGSIRDDLNYAKQIYAALSVGAVRIEEAGVVSVGVREVA